MEKLLADPRVVAEIQGEEPIRVEELSRALQRKYFHGAQQAAASKKLNREIPEVLNELVNTRVLDKEAHRLKIDRAPESREKVRAYEEDILFGKFVEKAIVPNIKVDDAATRKYYDDHPGEFSAPEMIRGEELAFAGREDAADALEKLRRGADFKWVKTNAPGQVEGKERQRVFPPEGGYVPMGDMAEGVREAVAGAGPEDYRFYASPKGQFFVLYILDVVPPKPYPFDSVKGKIEERMYREELQKSVEEWAGKLRAASEVKVFATDREMEKIFAPASGKGGKGGKP
jgi:parvulin-like peptidyl-prolyl isomerase